MESNIEAQRTEFYKKVEEIKAARNAYFADLEEKPLTYLKDYTVEKIQPSEMKVGDLMHQEGCIYKITKIKVFEEDDPRYPVYVAVGSYVGGSLSIYKLCLEEAANGYAKNHFTTQQGNARAPWFRVTLN